MTDLEREQDSLAWVELAELTRDGEATLLNILGLLRGIDPDIQTTASMTLNAQDAGDVLDACRDLSQWADALDALTTRLRPRGVEIRHRNLHRYAGAVLAAGVDDTRRLRLLARCLSVNEGFHALAEALRCTSNHQAWHEVTLGDVLSSFQGSSGRLARRVTEGALLSPDATWSNCNRSQISRLATELERFAATATSR